MVTPLCLRETVRRLRIVNAARVELDQNALSENNNALESIHFEDITTLIIEQNQNNPDVRLRSGQVSIRINRVRYVEMKTDSFMHWKEKSLNISITNVAHNCIIHEAAIVSNSHSSTVVLENITRGLFYSGTFATTLGSLTLRNVTTKDTCAYKTFAGRIGELSLTSVRLGDIQEGCFLADQKWGTLIVRSSHMGDILERGLRGKIDSLWIIQTSFGRIDTNGFDLDVTSLSINSSSIDTLENHALNVRSNGDISMHMSNITTVRENAFRSLSSKGIKLSRLSITKIRNGSLRVPDVRLLKLHDLKIHITCNCDIWGQVSRLFFGGNPPTALTKRVSDKLFESAFDNIRCVHGRSIPSLREYHCLSCLSRPDVRCATADKKVEDKSTETDQPSPSAVPTWIPVVASLGCLLLLVGVVIALLVMRRRRRSAAWRRVSCVKGPPDQVEVSDDFRRPMPDLTQEAQRMDTKSPGDVLHTGAGRAAMDSSVYESVTEHAVAGSGEELYEEIPLYEEAQGQVVHKTKPTQVQPIYTEVDKDMGKHAAPSENLAHAGGSSELPVYAQVNKTKTKTDQASWKNTQQAQGLSSIGSDSPIAIPETGPTGEATSDLPVYAQVIKNRPDVESGVSQPTGEADISAAHPDDDLASTLPMYAQVIKKTPSSKKQGHSEEHPEPEPIPEPPMYAQVNKNQMTKTSQANRHDPSQQTWSDAPLYEEIPGLATTGDVARGSSPRSAPGQFDPAGSRRTTQGPASVSSADCGGETFLHTDAIYSAVGPSSEDECEGFGEGLQYNILYGTTMSVD